MILHRVDTCREAKLILYALLAERPPEVNISHKTMPTWEEHSAFVDSHPYAYWRLLDVDGDIIGACYLTKQNEIGIQIFKAHQGKGYGPMAVRILMDECGHRTYLANINPTNEASIDMFRRLGFDFCQVTYRCAT